MAFELWPPSYLDMRMSSAAAPPASPASSAPATTAEPSPLRSTPLRLKKERDLRAQLAALPVEERARKLQEITQARNLQVLKDISSSNLPAPSRLSASSPLKRRNARRYHEGVLGCRHYQSNVALSAPCCNEFFVCRFCHDQATPSHQVDRHSVDRLQCMRCCHVQQFNAHEPARNQQCDACLERFARYYCHLCRLYDDDLQKKIYHCDECGVCRVGEAKDFFHCKGCNACLGVELRGKHQCIENTLEATCPVCACELKTSLGRIATFACGHCMHQDCLAQYRKHSYRCPCCNKSLGDTKRYFDKIEVLVGGHAWVVGGGGSSLVSCADCEQRSTVRSHVMYHKCGQCGSYNTTVIE